MASAVGGVIRHNFGFFGVRVLLYAPAPEDQAAFVAAFPQYAIDYLAGGKGRIPCDNCHFVDFDDPDDIAHLNISTELVSLERVNELMEAIEERLNQLAQLGEAESAG